MRAKGKLLVVASAFMIGLVMPILLSIVSMTLSFKFGVAAATVLVPLSSMPGLDEGLTMLGNGFVYAGIALLVVMVRNSAQSSSE